MNARTAVQQHSSHATKTHAKILDKIIAHRNRNRKNVLGEPRNE